MNINATLVFLNVHHVLLVFYCVRRVLKIDVDLCWFYNCIFGLDEQSITHASNLLK
jgi:hypothetical protein